MIRKAEGFTIDQLGKLSPSQYYAAKQCAFKLVLGRAFNNRQLLPLSPNAYLGSVLHKMIELVTKRLIKDEATFEYQWKEQILQKEEQMKANGIGKLTPLKYFAADFALKKLKVKNLIRRGNSVISYNNPVYKDRLSEKTLSDPLQKIIGVVDLIIEDSIKATIVDFKTGNIFEGALNETEEPGLKKEYEMQLKIYAYLYFLNKKVVPDHLYIVTLDQQFYEVSFTLTECEEIYEEAINLLDRINEQIISGNFAALASCSVDNCKFCGFRPACKYYHTWLSENYRETKDIKGVLQKVNIFGNGSVGLEIRIGAEVSLLNGFDYFLKDELESLTGRELNIYNLKKNTQSINAVANPYTVIYA